MSETINSKKQRSNTGKDEENTDKSNGGTTEMVGSTEITSKENEVIDNKGSNTVIDDFFPCPCCDRKLGEYNLINTHDLFTINCPCGISTRLYKTKDMLRTVWNRRPGAMWFAPVITVKHAKPRGIEGTANENKSPF